METTAGAADAQWYIQKYLFPSDKALSGTVVGKNGECASIAFATTNLTSVIEFYATNGRAVKCGSSKLTTNVSDGSEIKQTRGILKLGTCPKGLFSAAVKHANAKAFPSSIAYGYYACSSVDFHPHEQLTSKRSSYVVKASETTNPCPFSFCIRNFVEGVSLLTFDKGNHLHTCQGINSHLLPLSAKDKMYFLRGVMNYGGVKEFHNAVLVPRAKEAYERGSTVSRLDIMDLPTAERLARDLGIDLTVKAGEGDFDRVREILVQEQIEGATIAFKLSGWSNRHPKAIVHPTAEEFLQPEDLFILLATKMQLELLTELGTMASTDGTHAIFQYNNIKVIVVLVTSFAVDRNMKERGFPVCVVLCTSEREDVHKAIVAHLLASVPTWKPQLLMTDMAFSAFNAWVTFFPALHWLWCVFHVWQAWIKRLRNAARPEGMSKEDWSLLKGLLIREIKDLISPKNGASLSQSDFDSRCSTVSLVLWLSQLKDLAGSWDSYVANASRWSPPARRQVVEAVFGTSEHMPMLAKSNNCLEAFFGVLKYNVLDGRSLETASEFFNLLSLYQARIVRNVVLYGVLAHLVQQRNIEPDEPDIFAVEEELETNIKDDVDDIDNVCDSEHESQTVTGEEETFENARRRLESQNVQKELRGMREKLHFVNQVLQNVEQVATAFNVDDVPVGTAKQLRYLNRTLENVQNAGTTFVSLERYDGSKIKVNKENSDFVRQRVNYAPAGTFTPRVQVETQLTLAKTTSNLSTEANMTNEASLDQTVPSSSLSWSSGDRTSALMLDQTPMEQFAPSSSSSGLFGGLTSVLQTNQDSGMLVGVPSGPIHQIASVASDVPDGKSSSLLDGEADIGALFKRKRVKSSASSGRSGFPELSFKDYAARWISDPDAQSRVDELKRAASIASFPLLQKALKWNTSNRIKAVACDIFNYAFPTSILKEQLVSRFIEGIRKCVQVLPQDVNDDVADLGICHTSCSRLKETEIIFLERNAMSNFGEPCVAASDTFCGWVVRDSEFFRIGVIVSKNIHWGKLVEKRREVTICDN